MELQDVIVFAMQVNGTLAFPLKNTNKSRIDDLAKVIRSKLMKGIAEKCAFFSSTSDMWSSRLMKAFMAFTIHFLCDDFQRHNYTLAIKPTEGKHTGDLIREYMQNILKEWCLSEDRIVMMLRDSGSNMVKACEDWGIPHFPCIGHSLHLVVGPFLLEKKDKDKSTTAVLVRNSDDEIPDPVAEENDATAEENNEDVVEDVYSDEFNDSYTNKDALKLVWDIVSKVRKLM